MRGPHRHAQHEHRRASHLTRLVAKVRMLALPSLLARSALLALACALPACRHADGTITYPVLGLGFVRVADPDAQAHVQPRRDDTTAGLWAQSVDVVGIIVSPAAPVTGVIVGWLRVDSVAAEPGAEGTIDLQRGPGTARRITVHRLDHAAPSLDHQPPPPTPPASPRTNPIPPTEH